MKQITVHPEEYYYLYRECPACKGSFRYQFNDGYTKDEGAGIILRYVDCPICGHPCRHSHAIRESPKEEEEKDLSIDKNKRQEHSGYKWFSFCGFMLVIAIIQILLFVIILFK